MTVCGNLRLNSALSLTDGTGNLREAWDYDPYGRRTDLSAIFNIPNPISSDFGFTGHYYHDKSKLHLTLYRAYDADTGRWISRDPIGESGGINLYGYCLNDPVNSIDPWGLRRSTADRAGQFLKGVGATSVGTASILAAIPSGPLAPVFALSGAIAFQYGLGNMAAAFSPDNECDDQAAIRMQNFPSNLGELIFSPFGPRWQAFGGFLEGGFTSVHSAHRLGKSLDAKINTSAPATSLAGDLSQSANSANSLGKELVKGDKEK